MFTVFFDVVRNLSTRVNQEPTKTLCYYHVAYVFHSESALYSCLNVKCQELLV